MSGSEGQREGLGDTVPVSDGSATEPSGIPLLVVIGAVMLVGLMVLAWLGTPPTVEAEGKRLPALDLQPLIASSQSVSMDDLKGKVVVLHFWGVWCPPCQAEFPEFIQLAEHFEKDPSVLVLSVSCSPGPEYDLAALKQETATFLEQHEYLGATASAMPTYSDSAGMTRHNLALLLPNGSFGYPTTVVVDRGTKIRKVVSDYLPGSMEKIVDRIEEMH